MKKKGIVFLVATLVILLVVFGFLLLRKPAGPEKVEKVRIGLLPDAVSALLYIAQRRKLGKEGLAHFWIADLQ